MTDESELSINSQILVAAINKFARKHNLEPIEAMVLPALFKKAAAVVDHDPADFVEASIETEELGAYIVERAQWLATTTAVQDVWENFLQEDIA